MLTFSSAIVKIGSVEFKFTLPDEDPSSESDSTISSEIIDVPTKPGIPIHQLVVAAFRISPAPAVTFKQICRAIKSLYPYYGSVNCRENWRSAVKYNLRHNKLFNKDKAETWSLNYQYLNERQSNYTYEPDFMVISQLQARVKLIKTLRHTAAQALKIGKIPDNFDVKTFIRLVIRLMRTRKINVVDIFSSPNSQAARKLKKIVGFAMKKQIPTSNLTSCAKTPKLITV